MIYDFTTAEALRLSNIKRWGIVEMSRQQSVAEHTLNMMMIAKSISSLYDDVSREAGNISPLTEKDKAGLMELCLVHDLPEVYSGDVPTPLKRAIGKEIIEEWEKNRFPSLNLMISQVSPIAMLIKGVADVLEAIAYVDKWCVDGRRNDILMDLELGLEGVFPKYSGILVPKQIEAVKAATERTRKELSRHGGMN